ncbi:MAG: hypothetical protein PGN11_10740, partial [Quadrisphaera sp.]
WTAPGRGWGVVVVDELWNAVRVPELGAVVQEVVKKARTLGVELLGATQHLTDVLAAQESGRSFVHDADVVVSFRQEPVNARVFGEQLGFTEVEVAALEALGAHQAVWKVPGEPARAVAARPSTAWSGGSRTPPSGCADGGQPQGPVVVRRRRRRGGGLRGGGGRGARGRGGGRSR